MRIELLKSPGPQCAADIGLNQPSYREALGKRCLRRSQYVVDGVYCCKFHAGERALEVLVNATIRGENLC